MSESDKICWIITGGDTGTENQCIGIAEALRVQPVIKRIKLKFPWRQLSPWLCFGHRYALASDSDPVAPPYPDVLIASGRKSIGIGLHVKEMSGGKTLLVQIQDPTINPKRFDLVVVAAHDVMRGSNVMVTTGATHRVTPSKIAAAQQKFKPLLDHLPHPRIAVLIGGSCKSHTMTRENTLQLAEQLKHLSKNYGVMITASRRTGVENTQLLRSTLTGNNIFFWDGTGENPYFALLGFADYIIVTEDSVSMVSEAISTGKPVYISPLKGGTPRFTAFHQDLRHKLYTRPFTGLLETWSYVPPNDTIKVAEAIRQRMKSKE